MATREILLKLDEDDWDTIQSELAHRQARCRDADGVILPEGDSNLPGAIIAECIRDLNEYRQLWESKHGKD